MRKLFVVLAVSALAFVASAACSSSDTNGRCTPGECFVATTCRKGNCAGPVTVSGCCSCQSDEVNDRTCSQDAGGD